MIPDPDGTTDSLGPLWKEPAPGEFWQHTKGRTYQIVSVANAAATGERVVVYTGPTGTWSRPLSEFLALFVPAEVAHQREIAALRRVVRAFADGDIGQKVNPTTGDKDWWGACGFIHGASLPDLLKNLATASDDPSQHLEEMAAVEAALQGDQR